MRVAARHWLSPERTASLTQEMGMAAQAAWACARALELSVAPSSSSPPSSSSSADGHVGDDIALGPIEALNDVTRHVVDRFGAAEDRPAFLRETTGCLLSLSEAYRSCGGVDLVMGLDAQVGECLRACWQTRGLLIEVQRWHHEVVKTFDVCDDWSGALRFFVEHSAAAVKAPATATECIGDDGQSTDKAAAAAEGGVTPLSFVFKKPTASAMPSVFGASTVAMLLEMLNRNGKHKCVSELLHGRLVREAEAAMIGRAYAILINSWGNSPAARRLRSSGHEEEFAQPRIKMPRLVLDTKFNRSQS